MDSIPAWFSGIRLNWAENMLFSSNPSLKRATDIALTEVREGCTSIRDISYGELCSRTAHFASAMRAHNVRKGDRIAVVAGNSRDTLAIWLATASVGGIFSSSSTDMGSKGILERLRQVRPKWCFVDEGAVYNGKKVDLREKMGEIVAGMEGIEEFEGIVSVPRWTEKEGGEVDVSGVKRARSLREFLGKGKEGEEIRFERVGFNEPFLIVYSSGVSGIGSEVGEVDVLTVDRRLDLRSVSFMEQAMSFFRLGKSSGCIKTGTKTQWLCSTPR